MALTLFGKSWKKKFQTIGGHLEVLLENFSRVSEFLISVRSEDFRKNYSAKFKDFLKIEKTVWIRFQRFVSRNPKNDLWKNENLQFYVFSLEKRNFENNF